MRDDCTLRQHFELFITCKSSVNRFIPSCRLAFSILATMALGWDFGRPHFWRGPFLTGLLGFGDGSAPPTGMEKMLLSVGITSAAEDLYYNDHLHDGSKERRPKGVHVGDLAPMPVDLLIQGFRGRRDDPFPERFHTIEDMRARKKINKVLKASKLLKATGALSAQGGKDAAAPGDAKTKNAVLLLNPKKVGTLDEKAAGVPRAPTWAKESRLDDLLKQMTDREAPDFAEVCDLVCAYLQKQKRKRKCNLKLKVHTSAAKRSLCC
eukprot:570692-Prymnesium_polylepis.1